ncbi:Hsp20 family protein [Bacillus kwashiorkori]|uniref:Hsp20 family protein n=1 Tax=Bacillus kwashiorkori TaxID=1522318 RepID=UPI000781BE3F|nr:Hsp20 family protein [Bacillus kwashiorkori]
MNEQKQNELKKNNNNAIRSIGYVFQEFWKEKPFTNLLGTIDEFFSKSFLPESFKVRMKEYDQYYLLEAELPGIKKDQISITTLENSLTISISHSEQHTYNNELKKVFHRQSTVNTASRTIPFYKPINPNKIKGRYENGLLKLQVPKLKGKKVHIE